MMYLYQYKIISRWGHSYERKTVWKDLKIHAERVLKTFGNEKVTMESLKKRNKMKESKIWEREIFSNLCMDAWFNNMIHMPSKSNSFYDTRPRRWFGCTKTIFILFSLIFNVIWWDEKIHNLGFVSLAHLWWQ